MAVGLGFDVHRLVPGRPLRLGGIEVDHPYGLLGHSDGDVVLHALIDALLGAAGEGDIGGRFPDTDPENAGISSLRMLETVMGEIRSRWGVVNVDVVVMAEEPKIAPHVPAMRERLRGVLGTDRISIKGKTVERLGVIGRREAIAAWATVQLEGR